MSKFTAPKFAHLPLTTEYFSTVKADSEKGLVLVTTNDDGDTAETIVDPRLPVLLNKFSELVSRRLDKSSGPGVKAFATKTMTRIVKGVETIDPNFPGLPEMQAHLSVSTAKD